RNLDHRSEVAVPIYDKKIQQQIRKIIDTFWEDNTKARILGIKQNNEYRKTNSEIKVRTQDAVYNLFKPKKITPNIEICSN
ncbi:MAG TPA: hypothetical protein VNG53_06180, partial [Bacteroidia bacterium]|nr:hypothetical protein [Bacteroidia bacterium]